MNIPVLVDGPNFINRVLELRIAPTHLSAQLSIDALRTVLTKKIAALPKLRGELGSVEFFCSKKRFGPGSVKFTDKQQTLLLDRFRAEHGVYVDVIDIPGTSEKGVDMTISGKLNDYSVSAPAIILVSADRDFIPALHKLRHKTKILLASFSQNYPIELSNEAYATIDLQEDYLDLFVYEYQRYAISDLTVDKCAEMFSRADDRVNNQLRITEDGDVHLSKVTSAHDLLDVRCRFETYCAYNDYVGPRAASNSEYIAKQTEEIRLAWDRGATGFIDYPVASVWPEK